MHRVLAVDDSSVMHALYRQAFRRFPQVQLALAKNALEALESIGRGGEPNLILLDVNMPEMDGLECLARMRSAGLLPRIRVVMVSTETAEADVARARAAGAVDYLKKPFTVDQLYAVVAHHLALAPAGARPAPGA